MVYIYPEANNQSWQDPISTNKMGMMLYFCHSSYLGGLQYSLGWGKSMLYYLKNS
jgi:hypothetical protein